MAVTTTQKVALATTTSKRKYKKKEKSARQSAKGWMDGKRQDVFLPLVPAWSAARERGWQHSEALLKDMVNMYEFHFPWPMSDSEEPAELKDYDASQRSLRVSQSANLTSEQADDSAELKDSDASQRISQAPS
ncbi:hypothetical protein BDZ89DRAFT_1139736 [Hymenopellis radicata]|nr:hypothetical protein BDZ89DRAFT_1139736 [Hymenopellis radicata]